MTTRPSFLGDVRKLLRQVRDELRRNVRRYVQDNEPSNPLEGDLWVPKTGTSFTKQYLGGSWASLIQSPAGTVDLADGSVTNPKLGADAIDGTKIADDSIDSEHYVDGSIDKAHLSADCVDGTKIADDSIDSEHYVDGSIDTAHLAGQSVTAAKIANATITAAQIANTTITGGKIAAATILGGNIAAVTITESNLVDNTITELKRTVAAREVPSAGNTVLNHNNGAARKIYVDMGGGARTCTVENGVFDGQLLTIEVSAGGATDTLTLDNADANLNLQGDWIVRAALGHPQITLSWDATNSYWNEAGRRTAMGSDIDGSYSGGFGGGHTVPWTCTAGLVAGFSNTLTDSYAVAVGDFVTLAGTRCGGIGSYIDGTADADYAFGTGYRTRLRWYGEIGHSAGRFAATGHVQHSYTLQRVATNDDTVTTLEAPDALDLEANYTYVVRATVLARQDPNEDAGQGAYFIREALVYRDAAGAIQIGATQNVRNLASANAGGWAVTMGVSGNDAQVYVAGSVDDTVRWGGWIDIVRIQYA